jgi:hypothetical protein
MHDHYQYTIFLTKRIGNFAAGTFFVKEIAETIRGET